MKKTRPDALLAAGSAGAADVTGPISTNGYPGGAGDPMAAELGVILASLQRMHEGDFSVRLPGSWVGLPGKIADTFNDIVAANELMAHELARVGQAVGKEGRIRERTRLHEPKGAWREMEISINTLVDDLLRPTTEVTRAIPAVAQGSLNEKVRLDVDGRPLEGEFLRSANIVNTMIEQLGVFTSEVTRVAREVGTDGKLGGQAMVPGVAGTWKDLTDSVNMSDLDRIKGYQRGAVDYISVPVVPELLRAKVSLFAELHRKRLELEQLNQELEQRVAERTEELSERANLLDLASDAIIVRDMSGLVRFWNSGAKNLYGWRREQMIGQHLHKILATKFSVPTSRIEASLHETGQWEGNLQQITRSGEQVTVACRKALKIGKSGKAEAILEISRDITASLRAEEALRTAEKLAAMGRVAGIIAHEINNPLEAIHNIFHLIRHHQSLDAEAKEYARMAEQELSRVAHIVKQTLSFYRESQQPIEVSIAEVLDNVIELQSRNIHLQNVVVQKRYLADAAMQGFPGELRQVFMNLISNAIQAMPSGGRLRVTVQEHNDRLRQDRKISISVSDTGSGIKPDHAKYLFEPFFTTKAAKGTGLGLWISKGIVQKYDGSIRFRSLHCSGLTVTSFRVTFPAHMPAKQTDTQPAYSMSRA